MDPDQDSVTRLFHERGWRGINVEPRPRGFERFVERRPHDINLDCAVAQGEGPLTITEFSGHEGLSTAVQEIADGWSAKGLTATSITVNRRSLADICQLAPPTVHFLKIDVEGAERDVIESGDFQRFRPWVLAIEATLPGTYTPCHEEWEHIILSAGYEFALFNKINRYYVAKEHRRLVSRFTAPE